MVVSKVDLLAGQMVDWSVEKKVDVMVVVKVVNLESSKVYLKAD